MTTPPEQFVTIILVLLGVLLQLAFMYAPKFSDWYQSHPKKGLLALAFSAALGTAYFALSCTPFAAQLKIAIACTEQGLFTLFHAIYLIAITQQGTFLVLRGLGKAKSSSLPAG